MPQKLNLHWPTLAASFVLISLIAALVLASRATNDGTFIYALDDPYIHMSIARNFAQYGIWGLTRYEFSSSTSSILWTLLLSGTYLITSSHYIPLVLNVVFSVLSLAVADSILRSFAIGAIARMVLLLLLIFLTPLAPLALTGMEHTLQLLGALLFVHYVSKLQTPTQKDLWLLVAASALVTSIRYEGMAFVVVGGTLLLIRRRAFFTVAVLVAGLLPLIIYGLISIKHGSLWLPNSVLLKMTSPNEGNAFANALLDKIRRAPHFPPLILCAAVIWFWRYKSGASSWNNAQVILLVFVSTALLQLLFGGVGWFYRYEAFLIAVGFLACSVSLASDRKALRGRFAAPVGLLVALLIAGTFALLVIRGAMAIRLTTNATRNIYAQQYQMAEFLNRYYQGAVVGANDVGAINYFADIHCLDLWGLGSAEVTWLKLRRSYNTGQMDALARAQGMKIAVVYQPWFAAEGGIPTDWIKVAEWTTANCIICGYPTVSFYSTSPEEAAKLRDRLKEFQSSLPSDVRYRE